jgi:hypothetical protein
MTHPQGDPMTHDSIDTIISELRQEADNASRKAQYYRAHKPRNIYTHALQAAYEEHRALLATLALQLEALTAADFGDHQNPGPAAMDTSPT